MGVVYHTNYLVWWEVGRPDFIRARGMSYADMERAGIGLAVSELTARFHSAARYDDMIRVRIKDEVIRLYVYAYLQSFAGRDQMLRNEYGSVQQHLEAKHIAGIIIPIPPKWDDVKRITDPTRAAIKARERLEESLLVLMSETQALLTGLMKGTNQANGPHK